MKTVLNLETGVVETIELDADELAQAAADKAASEAAAPRLAVLAQIRELEASVTPRRLREAVLGDNGWLNGVNAQIAALRSSL